MKVNGPRVTIGSHWGLAAQWRASDLLRALNGANVTIEHPDSVVLTGVARASRTDAPDLKLTAKLSVGTKVPIEHGLTIKVNAADPKQVVKNVLQMLRDEEDVVDVKRLIIMLRELGIKSPELTTIEKGL